MRAHLASPSLWKETWVSYFRDKAPRMAAALSYYTIFALAPLLIITMGIASLIFGERADRGEVAGYLSQMMDAEMALIVQGAIQAEPGEGFGSTLVGLLLLLFGATGVFAQLKDATNRILRVKPRSGAFMAGFLKSRAKAFFIVLPVGFLIMASIAIMMFVQNVRSPVAFLDISGWEAQLLSYALTILILAAVFTWILRVVPDGRLPWPTLWLGASVTSILFATGLLLVSLYFTHGTALLGLAGSALVLLFWVYYSSAVFLLGVEFTRAWASRKGLEIVPTHTARCVNDMDGVHHGVPRHQPG